MYLCHGNCDPVSTKTDLSVEKQKIKTANNTLPNIIHLSIFLNQKHTIEIRKMLNAAEIYAMIVMFLE